MMIETKISYSWDRDVHRVGTLHTPRRLGPAALVFLGPPGAGKGTHAQHIANEYSLPRISTGDVFRSHVARKTALGLQSAEIMSRGLLVPDDVVCKMRLWLSRLASSTTKSCAASRVGVPAQAAGEVTTLIPSHR